MDLDSTFFNGAITGSLLCKQQYSTLFCRVIGYVSRETSTARFP